MVVKIMIAVHVYNWTPTKQCVGRSLWSQMLTNEKSYTTISTILCTKTKPKPTLNEYSSWKSVVVAAISIGLKPNLLHTPYYLWLCTMCIAHTIFFINIFPQNCCSWVICEMLFDHLSFDEHCQSGFGVGVDLNLICGTYVHTVLTWPVWGGALALQWKMNNIPW